MFDALSATTNTLWCVKVIKLTKDKKNFSVGEFFLLLFFTVFTRMTIDRYIENLLYMYECVIVPGFGGFIAQEAPAVYDSEKHRLLPPSKRFSFNRSLKVNDGLLANYVANLRGISYNDALAEVGLAVEQWVVALSEGEKVIIENVGIIRSNDEGGWIFDNVYGINYLTDSYGCGPVDTVLRAKQAGVSAPRSTEPEKPAVLQNSEPEKPVSKEIKMPFRIRRNTIIAASAAAIVAVGLFLGVSKLYMETTGAHTNQASLFSVFTRMADRSAAVYVETEPACSPETTIQTTEPANSAAEISVVEESLPAVGSETAVAAEQQPVETQAETVVPATTSKTYYIIAGAFGQEESVERVKKQIESEGYTPVNAGLSSGGLTMVAYAAFDNSADAYRCLDQIRAGQNPEAWIKVVQ